jgi:hypothetical protein
MYNIRNLSQHGQRSFIRADIVPMYIIESDPKPYAFLDIKAVRGYLNSRLEEA